MISIPAWRLSSLWPLRLGAIRCINAETLVTQQGGGDGESFFACRLGGTAYKTEVHLADASDISYWRSRGDELPLALTWGDKGMPTCWVTSTMQRHPMSKFHRAVRCSKAETGFPWDYLKVVGFLKCLQRCCPPLLHTPITLIVGRTK